MMGEPVGGGNRGPRGRPEVFAPGRKADRPAGGNRRSGVGREPIKRERPARRAEPAPGPVTPDPPETPRPPSVEDLDEAAFRAHLEAVMAEARRRAAAAEPPPHEPGSSCW